MKTLLLALPATAGFILLQYLFTVDLLPALLYFLLGFVFTCLACPEKEEDLELDEE